MKLIRRVSKPDKGFLAKVMHYGLLSVLPIAVYVAVSLDFAWIAAVLVILSKWRVFSIKFRYWLPLMRANSVDVFVGISIVILMDMSIATVSMRAILTLLYLLWLLFLKPRTGPVWVGIQALIGQSLALSAIFIKWTDAPVLWLVFAVWGVAYLSARHFLSVFDEQMSRATGYVWAFFAAATTWVLSHWLLMYNGYIAMPAVLLSILTYGVAAIYYLDHTQKLSSSLRWQFVGLMILGFLCLVLFSNWSIVIPS